MALYIWWLIEWGNHKKKLETKELDFLKVEVGNKFQELFILLFGNHTIESKEIKIIHKKQNHHNPRVTHKLSPEKQLLIYIFTLLIFLKRMCLKHFNFFIIHVFRVHNLRDYYQYSSVPPTNKKPTTLRKKNWKFHDVQLNAKNTLEI